MAVASIVVNYRLGQSPFNDPPPKRTLKCRFFHKVYYLLIMDEHVRIEEMMIQACRRLQCVLGLGDVQLTSHSPASLNIHGSARRNRTSLFHAFRRFRFYGIFVGHVALED